MRAVCEQIEQGFRKFLLVMATGTGKTRTVASLVDVLFVYKIINHVELHGYMENAAELTKPLFDKPISFIKLFDAKTRTALMETIRQVKENAVRIEVS